MAPLHPQRGLPRKKRKAGNESNSPISAEEIREQQDRLLRSEVFRRSARLARFLRFLVAKVQAGEEQPREYDIGVQVFDRGPHFDPRLEPIVRVEARRLRSKLKQYYETVGQRDLIEIVFPKGSYLPRFRRRGATGPPRNHLDAMGGDSKGLARLLRRVTAHGMRIKDLSVIIEAFEQSPSGLMLVRLADATIVHTNRRFRQISGFTMKELAGGTTVKWFWHKPQARQEFVSELLSRRRIIQKQARIRTRSGKMREVICAAQLLNVEGERYVLKMILP